MADKDESQKAEVKAPIVPINGKEADLRKAMPLTIGDAEELKAMGISLMSLDEEPENAYPLARYLIHKANPEISYDEIKEHVPVNWVARILQILREEQTREDIPF